MTTYPAKKLFTMVVPNSICSCFLLGIFGLVSCSDKVDLEVSEIIQNEFEKTYQYVVEHLPVESDYRKQIHSLRTSNRDALISVAYRWHTLATEECVDKKKSQEKNELTGYERMLKNDNETANSLINFDLFRHCLGQTYFNNWSEIQNMILFHSPNNF